MVVIRLNLLVIASCIFISSCCSQLTRPATPDELFRLRAEGRYSIPCYQSGNNTYHVIGVEVIAGDITGGTMIVTDDKYSADGCNEIDHVYKTVANMSLVAGAVVGETDQAFSNMILLGSELVDATKINVTVNTQTMTVYDPSLIPSVEAMYGVTVTLGEPIIVSSTPESHYGYLYVPASGGITMSILMPGYTDPNSRAVFEPDNHLTAEPE